MKDLRFTGHINGDYVDVRFRTDMINADDENFNIAQIQTGTDFSPNDKQEDVVLKYFSGTFQEKNTTLATCKQFAIDNGLNLRLYTPGSEEPVSLVHDHSDSTSI